MTSQKLIKLPFFDTIGRSFKYVFKNKALLIAVLPFAAILTVLQMILGRPYLCAFNQKFCTMGWPYMVTLITLIMVSIGIIINYCRSIILKDKADYISLGFWKRSVLYFLTMLGIGILIVVLLFPIFFTVAHLKLTPFGNLAVLMTVMFVYLLLMAPMFLWFPSIAVDDFSWFKISKLYKVAKGNINAIFWTHLVVCFPYLILNQMLAELYKLFLPETYIVNLLFMTMSITLSVVDACIKGAYFAHIYQFFKFYDKD